MKKLMILAAFLTIGGVAMAQQAPAKATTTAAVPAAKKEAGVKVSEAVKAPEAVQAEDAGKKEACSTAEKKSCGSNSGKKACCSSKSATPAK